MLVVMIDMLVVVVGLSCVWLKYLFIEFVIEIRLLIVRLGFRVLRKMNMLFEVFGVVFVVLLEFCVWMMMFL